MKTTLLKFAIYLIFGLWLHLGLVCGQLLSIGLWGKGERVSRRQDLDAEVFSVGLDSKDAQRRASTTVEISL